MNPGDRIGGAKIAGISNVHAAGRSNENCIPAGSLCYEAVVKGRAAAGTGAVAGQIHLFSRSRSERLDGLQGLFLIIKCLHHLTLLRWSKLDYSSSKPIQ